MMWGNYGMSGWTWGYGALVVVGVVILVVVLIRVFSGRRTSPPASSAQPGAEPSAKQILDERYARGDVTTEEYRERLSALGLTT
ncbi:SHOCT domain-containing protein [Glaciihabitans sp. UYNi722]|uniref:SHOCT domain-containing protein n=1 Tax=Glaciihabitans sp. UYNi722 TaxID=3156344 RepID=UPI0033943624